MRECGGREAGTDASARPPCGSANGKNAASEGALIVDRYENQFAQRCTDAAEQTPGRINPPGASRITGAGEAGRGFAAVASEVRNLAQRSSQAAKDIKDLIVDSPSEVQEGVELVNRAGASLSEIVEAIKRVAEIVSQIASASAEQSSGFGQINVSLSQTDETTKQNSAVVEEDAAAAKAIERHSHDMAERVSAFALDDAEPAGETLRAA